MKEKLCFIAGPEFHEHGLKGHLLVMLRPCTEAKARGELGMSDLPTSNGTRDSNEIKQTVKSA